MNTLLIEPLKYYEDAARRHNDSVTARFEELVNQSGIDVEQNRQTVKKYQDKLAEINVVSSRLMKFTALYNGTNAQRMVNIFQCPIPNTAKNRVDPRMTPTAPQQ